MEEWRKDARRDVVITDIDVLVPEDHLLQKIEKVMDYDWLYERLDPYYNHEVGRPGTDPVVLIKMVLIQHLFGIPSLRQTYERIKDTVSYRWFPGYVLPFLPEALHQRWAQENTKLTPRREHLKRCSRPRHLLDKLEVGN